MAGKSSKMAVVFGECGRECLSGPGNTAGGGLRELWSVTQYTVHYTAEESPTKWRLSVVSEFC